MADTDLSKSSLEQVIDLINLSNIINEADLSAELVSFAQLSALTEDTKNTSVRVVANANTKYTGNVVVKYDRLDIEGFASNYGSPVIEVGEAATFQDVVDAFNGHYGANLSIANDLVAPGGVFPTIEYTPVDVNFLANEASLAYIGNADFSFGLATSPLSNIIQTLIMNGLAWPSTGPAVLTGSISQAATWAARNAAACVAVGDIIHMVGGGDSGNTTVYNSHYRFDTATDTMLADGTAFPTNIAGGLALAYEGVLHVFGGRTGTANNTVVNTVRKYTEGSGWSTLTATMPVAAYNMQGIVVGEYAYLHSGINTSGTNLQTMWRYHFPTDTWLTRTNHPAIVTRNGMAYNDGKIYVMGRTSSRPSYYAYDIAGNSWSAAIELVNTGAVTIGSNFRTVQHGDLVYIYSSTVNGFFSFTDMTFTVFGTQNLLTMSSAIMVSAPEYVYIVNGAPTGTGLGFIQKAQ